MSTSCRTVSSGGYPWTSLRMQCTAYTAKGIGPPGPTLGGASAQQRPGIGRGASWTAAARRRAPTAPAVTTLGIRSQLGAFGITVPLLSWKGYHEGGKAWSIVCAYMQLLVIFRVWIDLSRKHGPVHNRAHLHPHLDLINTTEGDHSSRTASHLRGITRLLLWRHHLAKAQQLCPLCTACKGLEQFVDEIAATPDSDLVWHLTAARTSKVSSRTEYVHGLQSPTMQDARPACGIQTQESRQQMAYVS